MGIFGSTNKLDDVFKLLNAGKNTEGIKAMQDFCKDRLQRHKYFKGWISQLTLFENMYQDDIDTAIGFLKVNDFPKAMEKIKSAQTKINSLRKPKVQFDKEYNLLLGKIR